jgi:DNA-binding FrmR family transcriptional regulator
VVGRESYLTKELQTRLVNRLRRLEGHVRGVAGMIEREEPYDDVLVQIAAVKSALDQVTVHLLEALLQSCIERFIAERDEEALKRFKDSLALVLKRS